jgi:hypothetical protein
VKQKNAEIEALQGWNFLLGLGLMIFMSGLVAGKLMV